jgi:hypothetical protein
MLVISAGSHLVSMIDYGSVPAKEPVRCCNRHRMRPSGGTAESSAGVLLLCGHHLTDAESQLVIGRSFLQNVPAVEEPRVFGFKHACSTEWPRVLQRYPPEHPRAKKNPPSMRRPGLLQGRGSVGSTSLQPWSLHDNTSLQRNPAELNRRTATGTLP